MKPTLISCVSSVPPPLTSVTGPIRGRQSTLVTELSSSTDDAPCEVLGPSGGLVVPGATRGGGGGACEAVAATGAHVTWRREGGGYYIFLI